MSQQQRADSPPIDVQMAAGYSLLQLVEDINGATGFTEDKAAMGTIPRGHYLQIPESLTIPNAMAVPDNFTDRVITDFLSVNYAALTRSGVREAEAAFCSMLRLQMVRNGYACRDLTQRAIYVDEYTYNVHVEGRPNLSAFTQEMVSFVATYWANIVAVVAHIFRVRGHHFKPEYQRTYDRTWRAATIEVPANVQMPSWEILSRVALHPFGIRALHRVVQNEAASGGLSKGLMLRMDSACAGSAP
ncbi:hypothetical protein BX666DRAFT_2115777, partial [Dichotomocladium elegans]